MSDIPNIDPSTPVEILSYVIRFRLHNDGRKYVLHMSARTLFGQDFATTQEFDTMKELLAEIERLSGDD